MPVQVLAELMLKISFLAVLGFGMRKVGIITDDFQKRLSTILVNIVIPCSMLAVGNSRYDADMAGRLGWAFLFSFAMFAVPYLILYPLSRKLPLSPGNKNQFVNLVVLGNVGYIGFPIINELYGAEGMLYAVPCNLMFQFFAFSVGLKLMGGDLSLKSFVRRPMIFFAAGAIVLFLSPVRFPGMVVGALQQVSDLSAPFSMFIIGASLGKIKFRTLWTSPWAWLSTLLRQLAVPALMALALWQLGFTGVLPAAMVVLAGLPPGTLNVIFAEQYDQDVGFATRGVVQGTALMVLSLPLAMFVCSQLFF